MRTSPRSAIIIDLDAVRHNVGFLRQRLRPGTQFMAAVKADAYGHGIAQCARAVIQAGADMLGVATPEEALALRDDGFTSPILVMGPLFGPDQCLEMASRGVDYSIVSEEMVGMIRALTGPQPRGRIHLKIDSGMNRQGLRPDRVPAFLEAVRGLDGVEVVGVMTHFPCAPEDPTSVDSQLERFLPGARLVKEKYPAAVVHAANSAATLYCPQTHLDMVRCGIAVYGLSPGQGDASAEGLRPALGWTSQVALVKRVPAGEGVGYGHTYRPTVATDIAVVPIGYADGVFRLLGNRGYVGIRGRRYPMVGRVSMDSFGVDVGTDGVVTAGDTVTLIGRDGDLRLSAEDMAACADTINYEITCRVCTARADRVFIGER